MKAWKSTVKFDSQHLFAELQDVHEAAQIAAHLLEQGRERVLFDDIVVTKMDIGEGGIPVPLASEFARMSEMVWHARGDIKDIIEESHQDMRLVIIDSSGRSAMNSGGRADGYALRSSSAGDIDDRMRAKMAIGAIRSAATRLVESGHINGDDATRVGALLEGASQSLVPRR